MKIKKLEIFGFKSFADRAVVHFDAGTTGIVGPNGCGKSNVVDAMRWVMGEQNAKHLRGDSMQDIIFNGSSGRGPMGMAEVVLTLENDGNMVPQEYAHFSEIQVARRIYRNGDSEYEINKRQCRLKDITDLFLGTGVGTRAYSIIEQGRVTSIVSAKPEERRHMIEEAAGITKYKSRRQAAERKMEATSQNLARINDIIREVGNQLTSLEKQAKKAEKYHELEGQIKQIELHKASLSYFEITTTRGHLLECENVTRASHDEKEGGKKAFEEQIDKKKADLKEGEQGVHLTQSMLFEAENALSLARQDLNFAATQIDGNNRQLVQASEEQRVREQRLIELEKDKKRLAAEQTELSEKLQIARIALQEKQTAYASAREKRQEQAKSTEEIRTSLNQAQNKATQCQIELQAQNEKQKNFKTREAGLGAQKESLQKLVQEADARVQTLSTELELAKTSRQSLDAEIKDLQEQLGVVTETLNQVLQTQKSVHQEFVQKQSRQKSLQEIESGYEWSAPALGNLMKNKSDAIIGLVADFIEVPAELENLVEDALRSTVEAVIVRDEQAAVELCGQLSRNRDGRLALFAAPSPDFDESKSPSPASGRGVSLLSKLKVLKGQESVIGAILGHIYIVKDAKEALAIWPQARSDRLALITENGEVFQADGVIQGGVRPQTSGVLGRKREIRELDSSLLALKEQLDQLETQRQEMAAKKQQKESELAEKKERLQTISLAVARFEEGLTSKQDELKRLLEQAKNLSDEEQRIKAQLAESEERSKQLTQEWAQALKSHESQQTEVIRQSQALAQLDEQLNAQNEELTKLRIELASWEERHANVLRTKEQLTKNIDDIDSQLSSLAKQQSDLSVAQLELTSKTEILEKKISAAEKERDILSQKLAQQRALVEEQSRVIRDEESVIAGWQQELEALKGELNIFALQIQEKNLALQSLTDRLVEKYRTRVMDILCDFHMLAMPEIDLAKRIKDLERSKELLGAINLGAIREFEDLSQRHTFLKAQSDDLTQALAQLESAIAKVNRTTQLRFQEAFDAINTRFSQVFPRLFRGGRAWLELTDPNDLLTSGVEIYAEPPGKKLASMALMSGGEKALTATSLIFAIFLIKPSPFCLLDEVDAALDEANVDRFSRLVKEMSQLSQFIVITHNKRTMAVTDHLYGVTMEQAGISKVVGISIAVQEKQLNLPALEITAEA